MNFTRIVQVLATVLSTLLTIAVYSSSSAYIDFKQNEENSVQKGSNNEHKVPFLVLMSKSEICIAQLPMIDNGLVSVAYRLAEGLEEANSKVGDVDDDEEEVGERAKRLIADVRDSEQMPLSTSLGKSEWQQIVGRESSSGNDQEEVGNRNEEDAGSVATAATASSSYSSDDLTNRGEEMSQGLGRTNNSVAANVGISSSANGGVPESALLMSNSNVTSARSTTARQEEKAELAEGGYGGDKSSVQFTDFDVHMLLGYAFVADTRGRIHRIRLQRSGTVASTTVNASGSLERGADSKANLVAASDYYTNNAITDSSTANVNNFSSHVKSQTSATALVNDDSKASGSDGNGDDSDANKVGTDQVAHEQSGRHPTASGSLATSLEYRAANTNLPDVSGSGTTPISESHLNDGTNHKHFNTNYGLPKIIWSRLKNQRNRELSSAALRSRHEQPSSAKGASPKLLEANTGSQLLNASEQMESAETEVDEQQEYGNQNIQTVAADEKGKEQISGSNHDVTNLKNDFQKRLRTQITVDWLNNLLFVLDKYRLVVLNMDGNKELVLIDDFNINNRPLDIKVDPVNNFLFWLQAGTFHNTIYKLDLNVLTLPSATAKFANKPLKLGKSNLAASSDSESVALISHHYAHPIITNLPHHAELFIINHKHSRIYVPLAPSATSSSFESNKTKTDESEVVVSSSDDFNVITHLNTSIAQPSEPTYYEDDKNCTTYENDSSLGQILAYNLDGTDVGPLRSGDKKDHLSNLSDMQDITLDSERGLLYWLTEGGKVLFEEYRSENDSSFYSAEHALYGKEYIKLAHYGNNQPINLRPRFDLKKLIQTLSASTLGNRGIRSDPLEESTLAHSRSRDLDLDTSNMTQNVPYIVLGVTCFVVLCIYLVYTFAFQQLYRTSQEESHSSIDGSSVGSQVQVDGTGFAGPSGLSRWVIKPTTRSSNTSTFNRDTSGNDQFDSCDIESTNYDTSNAIDEHYRDVLNNQQVFEPEVDRLAYLNEWPANLHDMSNKLYVPVEVLQDEALSSIRRISIDQLEIERRAPLGKGHFGTVLQGSILCTLDEKSSMSNKNDQLQSQTQTRPLNQNSIVVPSSTSSGRGSSSTSSDFITATSCIENNAGDYMTPKSLYSGAPSDYTPDNENSSIVDGVNSFYQPSTSKIMRPSLTITKTKLTVAIKKLKDHASVEEKRDFLQEAKLLANFNHPNIVQLIGICLDRGSTLIVMELMLGGDLYRYMRENAPRGSACDLTEDDLLDICLDIVSGCCYLEDLNYIHRDLAARNCLVSSQKKTERVVKLADFGLARDIYKDSYYKKLNDSAMPVKWMAPECLTEQKFTTMSDVWSFGVVMWEVMSYCEERPFENVEHFLMKGHLDSGARLKRPNHCSDDIYSLMMACWEQEPDNRPNFQECKSVLLEIKNGRQ